MKENAFDLTVTALREQGLNSDEILKELSQLFQRLANTDKKYGTDETNETRIRGLLKKLGMPNNLKGYEYWVVAIQIYKENGKVSLKKEIYPQVAKICGDTPLRIERAMRNAVEVMFKRGSTEVIMEVFGNNVYLELGHATNKEFIATMAEQI